MKRNHANNKSEFHRTEYSLNNKNKISKSATPESHMQRQVKQHTATEKGITSSNHHFLKCNTAHKQQNVSPDITGPLNTIRYSAGFPLDEVTVKTSNRASNPPKSPKQRSRSTVSDRQPWGQLLSKHTNGGNENVFGKCDPLRTLHFLARELQTHLQARMPEEDNIQELIKAMQSALKRIPPEIASSVQLQQQTMELLPKLKKCISKESVSVNELENYPPEIPKNYYSKAKDFADIQKLIESSTMKLEASCRHLESMCGQLKDEKMSLEGLLQTERNIKKELRNRVEDLENENKMLARNVLKKDEEIGQLTTTVDALESRLQKNVNSSSEIQTTMAELKKSKQVIAQDNLKLQHELRVCAIEKEKFLAILAVRDRQIYEIKNEMTQLQQAVNEQFLELHSGVLALAPECRTAHQQIFEVDSDQSFQNFGSEDDKELEPIQDVVFNKHV